MLGALQEEGCNSNFAVTPWHASSGADGRGINHNPELPRQRRQDLEPAHGNRSDLRHGRRGLPALQQPLLPANQTSGAGRGGPEIDTPEDRPSAQHRGPESRYFAQCVGVDGARRTQAPSGRKVTAIACFDSFRKLAMTMLAACRREALRPPCCCWS